MVKIKKRKQQVYAYTYEESRFSARGIGATVLGGLSLLVFIILAGISTVLQGQAGAWSGGFGAAAFVIGFYGMVIGLKSFHDQCRSYVFCKVGTLLCGFMVAIWFLTFCVGLA